MHVDEREDLEEPFDGGQVLAIDGLVEPLRDDHLHFGLGIVQRSGNEKNIILETLFKLRLQVHIFIQIRLFLFHKCLVHMHWACSIATECLQVKTKAKMV